MKVTAVRTFLVDPGRGKNWLFVKVETDAGVHGWGECSIQLPTTPGLGLELDETELLKRPYREFPLRGIRQYDEEP